MLSMAEVLAEATGKAGQRNSVNSGQLDGEPDETGSLFKTLSMEEEPDDKGTGLQMGALLAGAPYVIDTASGHVGIAETATKDDVKSLTSVSSATASGESSPNDSVSDTETTAVNPPPQKKGVKDLMKSCMLQMVACIKCQDESGQKEPFKLPKPSLLNIIFLALNVVLTAIAFATCVVGILSRTDSARLTGLSSWDPSGRLENVNIGEVLKGASVSMTVGGLLAVLLGFLGCCGCIRSHKLMLKVYSALVGIAVAAQVIAIVHALVVKETIKKDTKDKMLRLLKEDYEGTANSTKIFSQFLDVLQVYFGCCGVTNWTNFENSPWYNTKNKFPLNNCSSNATGTSPAPAATAFNASMCKANLTLFPISCCQTQNELNAIVGEGNINLQNEKCQETTPGKDNPNTAKPCFDVIYAWLVSKVIFIN